MEQEIGQGVNYLKKCIVALQTAEYLPPLLPLCERLIGQGTDCQVMLSEELLSEELLSGQRLSKQAQARGSSSDKVIPQAQAQGSSPDREIPQAQDKSKAVSRKSTLSEESAKQENTEVMSQKFLLNGESSKQEGGPLKSTMLNHAGLPQGILYLTDDPLVYAALSAVTWPDKVEDVPVGEAADSTELMGGEAVRDKPVFHPPVLIYLHPGNQDADFGDARYALEDPQEVEPEYLERVYRRCRNLPWEILVTERCWLRETVEEDVDSFWKMYQDSEITQYTEQLYSTPEAEREYISEYRRLVYAFYEFGVWTVLDRQSGAVVGRAGLSVREGYDLPELGFVIGRKWQRRGLAKEVCQGILKYARELLGFDRIQVLVHEDNAVSLHLCRELGFREQAAPAAAGKSRGEQPNASQDTRSLSQTEMEQPNQSQDTRSLSQAEMEQPNQSQDTRFLSQTEMEQPNQSQDTRSLSQAEMEQPNQSQDTRSLSQAEMEQPNQGGDTRSLSPAEMKQPGPSGVCPSCLVEMEQNGQQARFVYMVYEADKNPACPQADTQPHSSM